MLYDNHNREINYLRLAITDRCNLRCNYCMPEKGLEWLPKKDILTYEEMIRLCSLLTKMGINKIRITGGEPFVRKDCMQLLTAISQLEELEELTLTTNGLLATHYIKFFKDLRIRSINLSLDTLDANKFFAITRRNEFDTVMQTLHELLDQGIRVKINAVVMDNVNTDDIIPLTALTKDLPIDVRFIEEMPFNGTGHMFSGIKWHHARILNTISKAYPQIEKIKDSLYSTSSNYHIPGHQGNVGVIASYSRTFCGTCNRLRITPEGIMKTCLYEKDGLNIKELVRDGFSDEELESRIRSALDKRALNGWDAEKVNNNNFNHRSMATIGG